MCIHFQYTPLITTYISTGIAPYNNLDNAGNYYALVPVTNANSVTINYRVYRTTNDLAAGITVIVA